MPKKNNPQKKATSNGVKKILIVANWKMNPQKLTEAKKLFISTKKEIKNNKTNEVVICPPAIYLSNLLDFKPCGSNIKFGSQNVFWEEEGAFTGEVSPKMLKNLGVKYIIIGHSERRKYFKETDEMINKKIKAVLRVGLKPILCIDKLSQIPERQRRVEEEIKSLRSPKEIDESYILAYEPLFAIGTGKACSIEKAKKMRKKINNNFVLYGGSVNFQNAKDYIKKAGFQGLLVGGASLNSKEFIKIIESVSG